jgi:nucleotide-binding universal stress UspA family protein
MMKKLLVPLDLNDAYENILTYAASLAKKSQAELTLFYGGSRRLLQKGSSYLYTSTEDPQHLKIQLKENELAHQVMEMVEDLRQQGLTFRLKIVSSHSPRYIIRETQKDSYDLLIVSNEEGSGLRSYLRGNRATYLLEDVNIPVFMVPVATEYNEIEHITYAVDLSEYDPNIIRQVKTIASLFDARLTIAHVNQEEEDGHNAEYLKRLEQTINDTLDYPKVYYKFFDHSDIFTGIKKFVKVHNSNMVAMINRKETSWRDMFVDKSLTRKMAQDLKIPLLAFRKS